MPSAGRKVTRSGFSNPPIYNNLMYHEAETARPVGGAVPDRYQRKMPSHLLRRR